MLDSRPKTMAAVEEEQPNPMPKRPSCVRLVSCALIVATTVFSPLHSFIVQAQPSPPSVVIGEVAWAGSTRSTSDEWLELWNLTHAPINVGGWSLADAGESGKTMYLSATTTIPALGTLLVANYADGDAKSELLAPVDVVTTTVSLSNSTLGITLFDAQHNVVDAAGDGSVPLAGATSPTKASMIRTDAMLYGTDVSAWTTATTSQNLVDAAANFGTPGFCDGCAAFAVPAPAPLDPPLPLPMESTAENATDTSMTDAIATSTPEIQPIDTTTTEAIDLLSAASSTGDSTIDETVTSSDPVAPSTDLTTVETTTTDTTIETAPVDLPSDSPLQTDEPLIPSETSATETEEVVGITPDPEPVPTPIVTEPTIEPTPNASIASVPTPPNYGLLRLNEVMPNPMTGKEWVEVISLDPTQTISLTDCELHDATGRIFTFGDMTLGPGSAYAVVEIPSSRLNNDGDTVSLFDPGGNLINSFTFGKTNKGASWIRTPDGTGNWESTLTPTEGEANILTQPAPTSAPQPTTTTTSTEPITVTPPISSPPVTTWTVPTPLVEQRPAEPTAPVSPIITKPTPVKKTAAPEAPVKTGTKKSAAKTAQTTTLKPTTKTVKAPAKKTSSISPIIPITFDMLNDQQDMSLRVKLQGTVGSPPGLLPKHGFILLADDGRGLYVSVPSTRTLPASGNVVSVTGTLRFNNVNVPYVSLASKDSWTIERPSPGVGPRAVDLVAPAIEDDWSFVQVTGTVDKVGTASFHLDLGDAGLTVSVRPVVNYRTQRLATGDVVTVSGLLDTSGDEPHLFPRSADEIVLVQHAPSKQGASTKNGSSPLTGWTPFGAAGGALVMTEGAKHLQRRRHKKLLEKKLADLTTG